MTKLVECEGGSTYQIPKYNLTGKVGCQLNSVSRKRLPEVVDWSLRDFEDLIVFRESAWLLSQA